MFEDGVKLDNILNVLRPPTLDGEDDKKNQRLTDAGIRYESSRKSGDDTISFEFAGQITSGVL